MKQRKLPDGWRLSEEYSTPKQAAFVKRMVEETSALPRIKREAPTTFEGKPTEELTQEERERFHFSLQPESTKTALLAQKERRQEDDIDHLLRPMPDCLANPDATNLNELTAMRHIDPIDAALHSQRSVKTIGQSDSGSVDSQKRQKGIEAFTYSKPAVLTPEQEKKLTKLTEIVNTPIEQKPKKKWWKLWSTEETRRLTDEEWEEFMGRPRANTD